VRNNTKALQGDDHYTDEDDEDGNKWDYMILDEVNTSIFYHL